MARHSAGLIAVAGLVIGLPTGVNASESTLGSVTVVTSQTPTVSANLPWSQAALSEAQNLIDEQRRALERDFSRLKNEGNTRVQVVYENQPLASEAFVDSEKYGTNFLPWHLVGNKKTSSISSRSYPLDKVDLAAYLTRPAGDGCSLINFSIFAPETWFQPPKCSVTQVKPQNYLAASLDTALKKSTLDVGSSELQQLKYALSPGTHPRINGKFLTCPELASVFGGTTKIALASKSSLGGYSISAKLAKRSATFTFIGPDLAVLAKSAYKSPGENFVRFFSSQVHD